MSSSPVVECQTLALWDPNRYENCLNSPQKIEANPLESICVRISADGASYLTDYEQVPYNTRYINIGDCRVKHQL